MVAVIYAIRRRRHNVIEAMVTADTPGNALRAHLGPLVRVCEMQDGGHFDHAARGREGSWAEHGAVMYEAIEVESDQFHAGLVATLNALGDRDAACPDNKGGCIGCEADAQAACDAGLTMLGYKTWVEFHQAEVMSRAG